MNIGPHDGQRPGLRTFVFQNNFDAANSWQEWRASIRRENSKSTTIICVYLFYYAGL